MAIFRNPYQFWWNNTKLNIPNKKSMCVCMCECMCVCVCVCVCVCARAHGKYGWIICLTTLTKLSFAWIISLRMKEKYEALQSLKMVLPSLFFLLCYSTEHFLFIHFTRFIFNLHFLRDLIYHHFFSVILVWVLLYFDIHDYCWQNMKESESKKWRKEEKKWGRWREMKSERE